VPSASVAASRTESNDLTVHRLSLPVPTARWIALIGLLLGVAGALITGAGVLRNPYDPTKHVDRYRHLIVPIAGSTFDPSRPQIDVTSIGARSVGRAPDPVTPPARRRRYIPRRRRGTLYCYQAYRTSA
jgi:hypothetical protein